MDSNETATTITREEVAEGINSYLEAGGGSSERIKADDPRLTPEFCGRYAAVFDNPDDEEDMNLQFVKMLRGLGLLED